MPLAPMWIELSGAQAYLAGSFPLTIETPSQIALQILNAVFFDLLDAGLDRIAARLAVLKPAPLRAARPTAPHQKHVHA